MSDQADKLRQLAQAHHGVSYAAGPPIVLVTGAEQGVGASTIARKLADCLNQSDIPTAFFDTSTERARLAGKTSADEPINAKQYIERMQPTNFQTRLVVVDCGVEIDAWTESLWRAAELALMVTTPEEHSFVRAYAQIKSARHGRITTPLHLTVNRADSPLVARDVHARIAETCRRFVGESVPASPPLPLVAEWVSQGATESTSPAWNAAIELLAQHVTKVLAVRRSLVA